MTVTTARVKALRFHSGYREELLPESNIRHEIAKCWINQKLQFDPNSSLENPLRFIEGRSDEMIQATGLFLVRDLLLICEDTKKQLLKKTFTTSVRLPEKGGILRDQSFKQLIKVCNPNRYNRHQKIEWSFNLIKGHQQRGYFAGAQHYKKELVEYFGNTIQEDMYRREIAALKQLHSE